MIWVDASVWLEIALDQENADRCQNFLELSTEESLFTADFDVYSIILTMLKYKGKPQDIQKFLGALHVSNNLRIFRPSPGIMLEALEHMKPLSLSFDDSLSYSCMQSLGINRIATLDRDYKKLGVEFVL